MARSTISDSDWWMFLGVVARGEHGGRTFTCESGATKLEPMEREGLLWIRLRDHRYEIQPTREGVVAAHRWAAKQAKLAAVEFGRVG